MRNLDEDDLLVELERERVPNTTFGQVLEGVDRAIIDHRRNTIGGQRWEGTFVFLVFSLLPVLESIPRVLEWNEFAIILVGSTSSTRVAKGPVETGTSRQVRQEKWIEWREREETGRVTLFSWRMASFDRRRRQQSVKITIYVVDTENWYVFCILCVWVCELGLQYTGDTQY